MQCLAAVARKAAETHGKGSVSAAKAAETHGKGSVSATKAAENKAKAASHCERHATHRHPNADCDHPTGQRATGVAKASALLPAPPDRQRREAAVVYLQDHP